MTYTEALFEYAKQQFPKAVLNCSSDLQIEDDEIMLGDGYSIQLCTNGELEATWYNGTTVKFFGTVRSMSEALLQCTQHKEHRGIEGA